jgi:hypothetical protein
MEPVNEPWSALAVKAECGVSVNGTGSFVRLSFIFLDHPRSLFFYLLTLSLFFLTLLFLLVRMFPHSPAFTVQRSNSSNSLSHRRRTELHATAYASLLDPTTIIHDHFDG